MRPEDATDDVVVLEGLHRLKEETARLSNWAFGIGAAVVVAALVAWTSLG